MDDTMIVQNGTVGKTTDQSSATFFFKLMTLMSSPAFLDLRHYFMHTSAEADVARLYVIWAILLSTPPSHQQDPTNVWGVYLVVWAIKTNRRYRGEMVTLYRQCKQLAEKIYSEASKKITRQIQE